MVLGVINCCNATINDDLSQLLKIWFLDTKMLVNLLYFYLEYFMNNKKLSDSYNEFLEKVIIGIREVSEITGVPIRKLRYWEDKGIITAVDSDASVRQFSLSDVKKIILINELIEDGYTLDGAAAKVEKRLSKINGIMEMISISNYN